VASNYYQLIPKTLAGNVEFRRDTLRMAMTSKRRQAQLWKLCAEDLLFYVNFACWTYDPRNESLGRPNVTPFITYPEFQDGAILEIQNCVENGRDFAMPKSRDMGASWMGLTVFEWMWHFRPNLSFLLVSRTEDYVDKRGNPKSLFWKLDFLHQHQPDWLLPKGRQLGWKDPERRLLHMGNADNGSVIDGESTTGDAGRGDRRTAMFIDEHAAFDVNDGFRILNATRDTTRCRGFNSTPQGAANGFFEVCHKTAARVIRLHWSRHPDKNKGLYTTDEATGEPVLLDNFRGLVKVRRKEDENEREVMYPEGYEFILDKDNPKMRSPWYDNECARCVSDKEVAQELDIDFQGSDYPFFDPKFISILSDRYCRPPDKIGFLEFDRETLEPLRFREDPHGNLFLWIPLGVDGVPARDRKFVAGSDISAGTGASNSVTSLVDQSTGEKIAVYRTPKTRPNPFAEASIALGKFFNKALMIWDASGPTGKVFTQRVVGAGYGRIYYRRNEKRVTRQITDEPGYFLNPTAKETLLEDYRDALTDRKFINRSEQGMAECLQFIRKPGGAVEHSASANAQDPSGARTAHGDEVIADALACLGVSEHAIVAKAEEPDVPVGSLAWRMQRTRNAERESSRELDDRW